LASFSRVLEGFSGEEASVESREITGTSVAGGTRSAK